MSREVQAAESVTTEGALTLLQIRAKPDLRAGVRQPSPARLNRYSQQGKLLKRGFYYSPAEAEMLYNCNLRIFSAYASLSRRMLELLLSRSEALAAKMRVGPDGKTPVAQGALMTTSDLTAKPKSGMDHGQRGAIKDAVAGRKTLTQQEEEDKRAYDLAAESKTRKLKDDEIQAVQDALTRAARDQPKVRTTSATIREQMEYRKNKAK